MALSIEQIEKDMAGDSLIPGRVADYRVYLAAIYSLRASEMQNILGQKPRLWLAIREQKKSDTAADREWEATDLGQLEMHIKWELKRLDKLSSALASKLRVMEGEARNQY
jgi:hypothetical protein